MEPLAYAVAAVLTALAGLVGLVCLAVARRGRLRSQAQLQRELAAARAELAVLADRVAGLSRDLEDARREAQDAGRSEEPVAPVTQNAPEPYLITGLGPEQQLPAAAPDAARVVRAIEAGRPVWVPAKPLRETLVRAVSVGYGVRRALSADSRDRIWLQMRAEVRRSRRRRRQELKALRRHLRAQRNRAA